MKHEFVRITGRKYRRADNVVIYLPDDKRTWRIMTHDGFDVNRNGKAIRFMSFEGAERYANKYINY